MRVFLTGATGFLGQYLLRELLERDHSVTCLYRDPAKQLETVRFLSQAGLPRQAVDLCWVGGDVLAADRAWPQWAAANPQMRDLDTLLHCAASMQLHMDPQGEPLRTNAGSVAALRRLLSFQPMQAHFISTAYVCGRAGNETVAEQFHPRGNFVNIYEESKWEAERLWDGQATLLRPSIIVGDSVSGRCTSFFGWYIFMQAVQLLGRLVGSQAAGQPVDLRLSLPVEGTSVMNIVPVDYVAAAAIRLIENPANHRRIFHLTHPAPPSNQMILDFVRHRFNFSGVSLAGAGTGLEDINPRNEMERLAYRQMESIMSYMGSNPVFSRCNTDQALPGLRPAAITFELMDRLLDYAMDNDWGQ